MRIATINGATTKAGKKFPTRIGRISNSELIDKPKSSKPPTAVISLIIGSVKKLWAWVASRLNPPWKTKTVSDEKSTPTPSVEAKAKAANPSKTDLIASRL